MISETSTFILGAGASKAFGYPTNDEIIDHLKARDVFEAIARPIITHFPEMSGAIQEIKNVIDKGFVSSIDQLIRSRTDLKEALKLLLAEEIIRHENQNGKLLTYKKIDWPQQLWRKLDGGNPNSFRLNKINFITFNYDRTLELWFHNALETSYGLGLPDIKKIIMNIPIYHVHGQVSKLDWEEYVHSPSGYRKYGKAPIKKDYQKIRENIKIIYDDLDENDKNELRNIHDIIQKSKYIYFMGLSYEKENLERLGFGRYQFEGEAYGCTFELPESNKKIAELYLPNLRFQDSKWDGSDFIKEIVKFN